MLKLAFKDGKKNCSWLCQQISTAHSITTTPTNMEADKPKTLHIQPVDIDDKQEDITSFVKDMSPRNQHMIKLMLKSLQKDEAVFEEDNKGRPVIQYKDEKSSDKLIQPSTDDEAQFVMEACLQSIEYKKKIIPISGVVFDPTHPVYHPETPISARDTVKGLYGSRDDSRDGMEKIQIKGGQYREGKEFTEADLGMRNVAGKTKVVKMIMMSLFRTEEVRALKDLKETGISPAMYCFQSEGQIIHIFMEKIDNGVTLRNIIDTHMGEIKEQDPNLVRPFSLYVFHGLLSAVHTIHQKGWTHRDLHADNIMLQKSPDVIIKIRILDFGSAELLNTKDGMKDFRTDLAEVLRKCTALYVGQNFESETDIRKNWEDKIGEVVDILKLSTEDRSELMNLVKSALDVASLSEVPKLLDKIKAKMNFDTRSLLMKVAKILFPKPDDFQPIHPDSTGDGNTCTAKSDQNDVAHSLQDLNVECQKHKQVMGPSIKAIERYCR